MGRDGKGRDDGGLVGESSLGDAADGALARIARQAGAQRGSFEATALWRQMGDRRLRAHTRGLFLAPRRAGRELTVYVDSPGWAQEFQMLSPSYLVEWNHLCDREGKDLRAGRMTFRVSSRSGGAVEAPAAARKEFHPVPLDADELARVEEAVSVIHDDVIRRKAYNAMKSVLEWQKSERPT